MEKRGPGRPAKPKTEADNVKSSMQKLQKGFERYTLILPSSTVEDVKNIAYWDRNSIKEVAADAFTGYIDQYKANNPEHVTADGKIKPRPAGA